MKPAHVNWSTYFNSGIENNDYEHKFEVADHKRISIFQKIFAKDYILNWSKQILVIKKVKKTVPWTYVIRNLNGKEIIVMF